MVKLSELVSSTNNYLQIGRFDDYCPNGLQVEGAPEVARIISGVTASQQLIDKAIDLDADALLVHHGYFWKGEDPCLRGMKRSRIAALLKHNISLLAYHLPLDQHPVCGNNARLAGLMGWEIEQLPAAKKTGSPLPLLCTTTLDSEISGDALANLLESSLGRVPQHIDVDRGIRRVGWCTGAAQNYLLQAAELGVDAFISGEVSEKTFHEARETGVHYFAAGHHATERYGVQALGDYLASRFDLEHDFVDCDNPV